MPYQGLKNEVFNHYTTAVVLVFIFIVLLTTALGLVKYHRELDTHEQQTLSKLKGQGDLLNAKLDDSVQAILGMQKFANYALAYPNDFVLPTPNFAQNGALFHLELPALAKPADHVQVRGNITGLGDFTQFNNKKVHEISMAKALTPAFVAAKMSLDEATWFYYLSLNEFVNIYPWIDRKHWHYSNKMLDNAYLNEIIIDSSLSKSEQADVHWSSPYIDAAGSGLNTSLSAKVLQNNKMVGAVVIDINLAKLGKTLPDLLSTKHGLVLINEANRIMVSKQVQESELTPETVWQDIVPNSLSQYSLNDLLLLPTSKEIDGWLLQKLQLPINGWTLLKYQPYDEHIAPIKGWFVQMFLLFFSGIVIFLALVYFLTRKTFIKPATDFIHHIELCAQGEPNKVKPTADWQHWFNIVENIFSQNRQLLEQLKDQNKALDQRVNEKTHELMKSSQGHKRDYALLRSVMNAIPELIIFNDNQGKLIGCNKAFEEFVHVDEAQLMGLHATNFMPLPLSEMLIKLSTLSLQCSPLPNENNNIEDYNMYHQGVVETNDSTFEVVSRQFFNDTGGSLGTINIFRDVTKQTDIQSALKTAKEQAESANQTKNQFLANVSHEIRTPINAMTGMINLLERTSVNTRQQHYLENAKDASESLLHLIDELLDLSKIEAGKMVMSKQATALDKMVNKTLNLNRGMANNSALNIVVEIGEEVPDVVLTDEIRLIQVLSNLLNNALKFTRQGKILISLNVTAKSDSNVLIKFTVKDEGIGISKDKQQHLFDAFSQADESMTREYGGSGLGLSICQQIVNLLGGEITLVSDEGQGSEFSFVLPLSLPHTIEESVLVLPKNQAPQAKVTLVTFNNTLPNHFSHLLTHYGWQITSYNSLANVLSIAKDHKVILHIDSFTINSESAIDLKSLLEHPEQPIKLLVLSQSAINPLNDFLNALLKTVTIPYLLLDIPLYRYSLKKMKLALDNALVDSGNSARDEATLAGHVPLNNATDKASATAQLKSVTSLQAQETPLAKTENVQSPTKEQTSDNGQGLAGVNLLLVEDNLVNQLVAKELLISMGANVVIAENGQVALTLLAQHNSSEQAKPRASAKFDAVLMDIQMPIMDGITATKAIRKQPLYNELPILAMTAHASNEDKRNCLAVGMSQHISKPINADILLTTILSALPKKEKR